MLDAARAVSSEYCWVGYWSCSKADVEAGLAISFKVAKEPSFSWSG